jgi:hypothetical protein
MKNIKKEDYIIIINILKFNKQNLSKETIPCIVLILMI